MFTMVQETEKSCSRLSRFSCWDLIRRIACSSLSDGGEDAKESHFLNSADPTISEPAGQAIRRSIPVVHVIFKIYIL